MRTLQVTAGRGLGAEPLLLGPAEPFEEPVLRPRNVSMNDG